MLVNEVETAFPPHSKLRTEFLTGAIKWTVRCGSRELGDPTLNGKLAECLWDLGTSLADKVRAVYPFCVAEQPMELWKRIKGSSMSDDERGSVLAYATVQFLAIESIRDAGLLFGSFKSSGLPVGNITSDLIVFVERLLQVCICSVP
jgi:Golgi to ER traffic protein 4